MNNGQTNWQPTDDRFDNQNNEWIDKQTTNEQINNQQTTWQRINNHIDAQLAKHFTNN